MADYISREAAIEAIMQEPPEPHYPAYYGAVIQTVPAADVEPVRAGAWIPISDGKGAECSECGEYYDLDGGNHSGCFADFTGSVQRAARKCRRNKNEM